MSKKIDKSLCNVKIIAQLCNVVVKTIQQSYIIIMTNKTKIYYSFAPGIEKITLRDAKCVKKTISDAIGVKNRQDFCRKKRGILNIPKHQYDLITSIFERYGLSESDVWRITPEQ